MDRTQALGTIEKALDDVLGNKIAELKEEIMEGVKDAVTGEVAEGLGEPKKKKKTRKKKK